MKIKISIGNVSLTANLKDNETARRIYDALPFNLPFNTTCLNSADVSPWMEIAPKSSFNMIRSGYGNKETSPLCIPVYVPYGMDTEIQVQGTGKGSG